MSVPERGDGVTTETHVSEETIRVRLNGVERELPAGLTVEELLRRLELRPELVVVELNRVILTRGQYGAAPVVEGDTLELVHFVGGGRPRERAHEG